MFTLIYIPLVKQTEKTQTKVDLCLPLIFPKPSLGPLSTSLRLSHARPTNLIAISIAVSNLDYIKRYQEMLLLVKQYLATKKTIKHILNCKSTLIGLFPLRK